MRITSISHASLPVETNGIRILTDPWYEGTIYNDAWELCPTPPRLPDYKTLDGLFISHAHPDHSEPRPLGRILAERGPGLPIFAARFFDDTMRGEASPAGTVHQPGHPQEDVGAFHRRRCESGRMSSPIRSPMHRALATGLLAPCLWLGACGEPSGVRPPAQMHVTDGDGQAAPVGTLLPEPIVVTVVDAGGTPTAGARVQWRPGGDARLTPINSVTDARGQARARWLLGSTEGVNTAEAALPGLDAAVFTATAEPPGTLPYDELRPIELPTYDGSGQVVHPDHAYTPAGVFGRGRQLAITPYPFGDARFENPSLFGGSRPDAWSLASGVPNPIVLPDRGYLSDPDMVYVAELEELWLYYRQVTTENIIQLVRSRNGREWSAPVVVVRAPNHQLVSPSVVRRGPHDWWMFSINSGPTGCSAPTTWVEVRRSSDGLHWSAPERADLAQHDLWPWHIDVQWIPSENAFWAIYNAKTVGGCTTPALFMASSANGAAWQVIARPVLAKGRSPAFQDIVYRSTFEYQPQTDALTFWYSGAKYEGGRYVWSAAVERRRRADVFAAARATLDPGLLTPAPAPLTDWP